ncbi:uncharacterized protein LOC132804380 [Ziziphus jujuba]|uniref:Uncharacterized protein LOC132804380 n=1 Tax=Ziziphus jujuba TaxID=326968 RepID=A0ABM4AD38_ZIZJJ|nr:uncharacterized protein LOC132804380 [Ziziphus jujuba]
MVMTCQFFGGIPLFSNEAAELSLESNVMQRFKDIKHFTDLVRQFMLPNNYVPSSKFVKCLYSAKELHRAGVDFVPRSNKCLTDALFNKKGKILEVPTFMVEDTTECLIRNVMVLEQCLYPFEAHICNYISLLDKLINTDEDVELLHEPALPYIDRLASLRQSRREETEKITKADRRVGEQRNRENELLNEMVEEEEVVDVDDKEGGGVGGDSHWWWGMASAAQLGWGIVSFRRGYTGQSNLMPFKAFAVASLFVGSAASASVASLHSSDIHKVEDLMEVGASIRTGLGIRPRTREE